MKNGLKMGQHMRMLSLFLVQIYPYAKMLFMLCSVGAQKKR